MLWTEIVVSEGFHDVKSVRFLLHGVLVLADFHTRFHSSALLLHTWTSSLLYFLCTMWTPASEKFKTLSRFVPFLRAVSSGSRFRLTVTTLIRSRFPPWRIMLTTCLWPTFTTFSWFTCGRATRPYSHYGVIVRPLIHYTVSLRKHCRC